MLSEKMDKCGRNWTIVSRKDIGYIRHSYLVRMVIAEISEATLSAMQQNKIAMEAVYRQAIGKKINNCKI